MSVNYGAVADRELLASALRHNVNVISLANADAIVWNYAPLNIDGSGSYSVRLGYTTPVGTSRDLHVHLFDSNWSWLGEAQTTVSGGVTGEANLLFNLTTLPAIGSGYRWKAELRPVGGSAGSQLKELFEYDVTVR